jgi:hypothetical protein
MAIVGIGEELDGFEQCFRGVGGFHTYSIHSEIGFSGGFLGFLQVFCSGVGVYSKRKKCVC